MDYKYFYAVQLYNTLTRTWYAIPTETGFIELDFEIENKHTLELATKCIWEQFFQKEIKTYKYIRLISFSLVDVR